MMSQNRHKKRNTIIIVVVAVIAVVAIAWYALKKGWFHKAVSAVMPPKKVAQPAISPLASAPGPASTTRIKTY